MPRNNLKRWSQDEEEFIRQNAGKLTFVQMGEQVGRSALAVQLFMHRRHIVPGGTVRRNLVQEMLRLKFIHPENFMPTRSFFQATGINQMRWWDIYNGRKNVNETEYLALARYFGITLEEAFEARPLSLFETGGG